MRNTMKVAKWEIKRNLKNKSFLIGLFLTPILFLGFMFVGSLFGDSEDDSLTVFVQDNIGVFSSMEEIVEQHELNWNLQQTDTSEDAVKEELESSENTAYIFVGEKTLNNGTIPVYTSDDMNDSFMSQVQVLAAPVKTLQMQKLGLSDEELAAVSMNVTFNKLSVDESTDTEEQRSSGGPFGDNLLERVVPGAFAGIILLSIIFSGMYIFQSASNEKKDKIAEIILSSLTPGELMQGKIFGYFALGMIQAVVFLAFSLPIAIWKLDVPIIEYLFVPELILFIAIAIMGYFLFAALFVGVGATMADMTSAGNFQGMVMMLPFLPFVFIGPVISDPGGLFAQIGSFIPFTAPGVLLLRLTMLEELPWMQIIISLVILTVSIWIFMKLAGKIFKTGILMYGKNATPAEIWKWIRA